MADQPYSGPEIQEAIRILKEDAHLAGTRRLEQRLDAMQQRIDRMPVAQMTPEEKAAEYDRIMSERGAGAGGGAPAAGGASGSAGGAPGAGGGGGGDGGAGPDGPPAPPQQQRRQSAAEGQGDKSWWSIYQKQGSP